MMQCCKQSSPPIKPVTAEGRTSRTYGNEMDEARSLWQAYPTKIYAVSVRFADHVCVRQGGGEK